MATRISSLRTERAGTAPLNHCLVGLGCPGWGMACRPRGGEGHDPAGANRGRGWLAAQVDGADGGAVGGGQAGNAAVSGRFHAVAPDGAGRGGLGRQPLPGQRRLERVKQPGHRQFPMLGDAARRASGHDVTSPARRRTRGRSAPCRAVRHESRSPCDSLGRQEYDERLPTGASPGRRRPRSRPRRRAWRAGLAGIRNPATPARRPQGGEGRPSHGRLGGRGGSPPPCVGSHVGDEFGRRAGSTLYDSHHR